MAISGQLGREGTIHSLTPASFKSFLNLRAVLMNFIRRLPVKSVVQKRNCCVQAAGTVKKV